MSFLFHLNLQNLHKQSKLLVNEPLKCVVFCAFSLAELECSCLQCEAVDVCNIQHICSGQTEADLLCDLRITSLKASDSL